VRLQKALDVALAELNEEDAKRRIAPSKWRELHDPTRRHTVFRKGSGPTLPSLKEVVEQTSFESSIFNYGFDEEGEPILCPVGEGDRWHGREARDGGDAAWVGEHDRAVTEWLDKELNWLATTTGGSKSVNDTHALKAGVNSDGEEATTREQRPLHADSCWPNTASRTPWGDAHLVILEALQDGTKLPVWPKKGCRQWIELNAGDVVVFRGDLIHCGAEYTGLNVRIHTYVDSPAAERRDPNATYYEDEYSW